jgi:hypothetical protein
LRGLWVLDICFTVIVTLVLVSAVHQRDGWSARGYNIAAATNVENTLAGIQQYYADNDHSFAGLNATGSEGVSPIQSTYGLSFTAEASTGPHLVSLHLGRDNSFVVMAAFQPGVLACYGVLWVTARQPTPVFGETARGTYFFVVRTTTAAVADCDASTLVPSAISTTGFPSG